MKYDKKQDSDTTSSGIFSQRSLLALRDCLSFVFFCFLLCVPVYAIARSAMNHDWVMMMLDALLVPVGFVHGLLMLLDIID